MTGMCFEPLTTDRFTLGEGARCIDGLLHVVDILAGRAYRYAEGRLETVVESSEPIGAIAPIAGRADSYVIAEGTAVTVGSGTERTFRIPLPVATDAMRVNDAVVDPAGRFWVGTMPVSGVRPIGAVYSVGRSGLPQVMLEGTPCPNGPAFAPDGTAYFADSLNHRILKAPPGEGRPMFREFARVEGGFPDGMTVDFEGMLWVAVWGAGEVVRLDADARVVERIPTGARQPSSVCLLDLDGRRSVVVTTATQGLGHPGQLDGAVLVAESDASAPQAIAFQPGGLLG